MFKKIYSAIFFIFFVFLLFFFSCNLKSPTKNLNLKNEFTIYYTANEKGEIRPCGCAWETDVGGLARRATILKQQATANDLIIEGGDVFLKGNKQQELKAKTAILAMQKMGYKYWVLGEKDLYYDYLLQKTNFTFISANLNSKILNIKPYIILKINNSFSLGITGILPSLAVGNKNFQATEDWQALKKIIPQIKNHINFIIIFSHLSEKENLSLTKRFPEINLIISVDNDEVQSYNKTKIISVADRGRNIGKIKINLKNKKILYQLINLDNKIKDDPEITKLYNNYNKEVKKLAVKNQKIILDKTPFLTFVSCKNCHQKEFNIWKNSQHSQATKDLKKSGREYDPECLICHSTGYNQEGGFLNLKSTPQLTGVQCESCHNSGAKHIKNLRNLYGKVNSENFCAKKCHDKKNSPKFNLEKYLKKIKHWE